MFVKAIESLTKLYKSKNYGFQLFLKFAWSVICQKINYSDVPYYKNVFFSNHLIVFPAVFVL
jgi:hypothetical protein